jgi:transcriptional regulator with XRE-family HTH domain
MDIRRVFAANLKRHRLTAGLSQEAVAARMGVDRAFISAIERGAQNVTLTSIWLVSEALAVRPAALFDEEAAATFATTRPPALGRRKRTKS